jgi:hypothetical protein
MSLCGYETGRARSYNAVKHANTISDSREWGATETVMRGEPLIEGPSPLVPPLGGPSALPEPSVGGGVFPTYCSPKGVNCPSCVTKALSGLIMPGTPNQA